MGEDRTLLELGDRAAIRDLLMRYGRSVDRRDFAEVATCFTPDATYDGTLGHGTIGDALQSLRERMGRFRTTMHFISTQVIDLRGDTAACETYALVYHRLGDEEARDDLIVGVRYLDDLTRDGDSWRIRHRTARLEWERYDAVILPPGEPPVS
jgi:3-phenylpropionate/cinnamic acid dioxygenase small subunit